jgi:hypothetical protein
MSHFFTVVQQQWDDGAFDGGSTSAKFADDNDG